MGLSARLGRAAVRRPHVLLVPVPGYVPLRWKAEDALDALGWPTAGSPAGADVLLCCGRLGPQLSRCVEVTWDAMPGPRTRLELTENEDVAVALRGAVEALADLDAQRLDALDRATPALSAADTGQAGQDHGDMDHAGTGDGDVDHAGTGDGDVDHAGTGGGDVDHAGMGDGDMDHSAMADGGMDHSMHMSMDLPGGMVMADRVGDRDGLRLEGLNLSLGPLLPTWPAGLRLDVVLSGDVLVRADVVRLDPRPEVEAPQTLRALDALATLLAAAGWSDGALRARRARAVGGTGPRTDDLLRRVGRARLLRWSLRGLPAPDDGDLAGYLDQLVAAVRGDADLPAGDEERLARDVVGLDVGTAALVVAGHGPLLNLAHARA